MWLLDVAGSRERVEPPHTDGHDAVVSAAKLISVWIVTAVVGATANEALAFEDGTRDEQYRKYFGRVASTLGAEQTEALSKIRDAERRDLATVYYLRAGDSIAERWSWSQRRIDEFSRSAEYSRILADIDKVRARFSADNPGFGLRVNTQIRSLETQIRRWAEVPSIGAAAAELKTAARNELLRRDYEAEPTAAGVAKFKVFLMGWRPSRPPTLAAPGMSLHGRSRAFDFDIVDIRGNVVATSESASVARIWDGEGWTTRLSRAVLAASGRFIGPLAAPREPWHYEYRHEVPGVKQ